MEITKELLFEGKSTIIKNKNYLSTKEYVEPFFDEMSKFTDDFIIRVQTPNQMTLSGDNKDITFNRVWIQALMPEDYAIDNHRECYHLIYGLDVKKPVYKVARGYVNMACTNLCIFNPQWLSVQELEPEKSFIYSISNLMKMTSDFESRIKKMKSTFLSPEVEDRQKLLGSMIEKSLLYEYSNQAGKVKLSPAMVVKAYENVYMNTDSPYYVKDTEECSVFNYYNAFTELIKDATKKDLMTGYEKTLLVGQLFDLVA